MSKGRETNYVYKKGAILAGLPPGLAGCLHIYSDAAHGEVNQFSNRKPTNGDAHSIRRARHGPLSGRLVTWVGWLEEHRRLVS